MTKIEQKVVTGSLDSELSNCSSLTNSLTNRQTDKCMFDQRTGCTVVHKNVPPFSLFMGGNKAHAIC